MTDTDRLNQLPTLEADTTRRAAPGEHRPRAGKERPELGQERPAAPAYYDVPMLKPPVWKGSIPSYFFLGGLSGGAYALARMAACFGGERYRDVTQAGTAVAAAAFLPCPLLLIQDLGDPKRFHYMLRVFKPQSPMNLGSWVLTGFGGILALAALNEWRKAAQDGRPQSTAAKTAGSAVDAAADAAGVPLALLLTAYTGVLLSTTSTPLWARNPWLAPLFSVGGLSTGASAISLALEAKKRQEKAVPKPMQQFEKAARIAETVTLGGYLADAGRLAQPLTTGKYAPHFWGGAVGVGLLLPTLLENLPVRSEGTRRWLRIAGAAAGLAGGFLLRWAITQAGHPSGSDPQAARDAGRKS